VVVWRQRRRGIAKWSSVMVESQRFESRRSKVESGRPKGRSKVEGRRSKVNISD
jgi:hypothetical protein